MSLTAKYFIKSRRTNYGIIISGIQLLGKKLVHIALRYFSIIGFPASHKNSAAFPIWKTGYIASEPNLDYQKEPLFLIDSNTKGSMSGSPVVLRETYRHGTKSEIAVSTGVKTLFLGVYSKQLHEDPSVGRVWRPETIEEILNSD